MTIPAQLPLFPLKVVLFPGMPLPLHVFEERYKHMIGRCIDEQTHFGVVLIRAGEEVGGPAEPHSIGTSAAITQVERLSEGRYNITALGCDRFRIDSIAQHEPYMIANVSAYPLAGEAAACRLQLRDTGELLGRYVRRLARMANEDYHLEGPPKDPVTLACLTAIVLQVSLAEKQAMLEIETIEQLLHHQKLLLRREISLLDFMLRKRGARSAPGARFSEN